MIPDNLRSLPTDCLEICKSLEQRVIRGDSGLLMVDIVYDVAPGERARRLPEILGE